MELRNEQIKEIIRDCHCWLNGGKLWVEEAYLYYQVYRERVEGFLYFWVDRRRLQTNYKILFYFFFYEFWFGIEFVVLFQKGVH